MSNARIRLRPLRREDSDLLYQWINDRELRLFSNAYHPVTDYEHERWMESMLKGRDDTVLFIIEHIKDERPIGSCQLKEIDHTHRKAELLTRIGERDYWGKGLGTEVFKDIVRFAFDDLNLHRIKAEVHATNPRSIKALEKAGFTQEGLLKDARYIDGEYVDVKIMAIVNS